MLNENLMEDVLNRDNLIKANKHVKAKRAIGDDVVGKCDHGQRQAEPNKTESPARGGAGCGDRLFGGLLYHHEPCFFVVLAC